MKKRIVVTGLGTVNPLGNSVDDFWDGIKAGKSGVGPITLFDASEYTAQIAGEVKDLDPDEYLERSDYKRVDRFSLFAMVAGVQAMKDADFKENDIDPAKLGVILGNGIGGLRTFEDSHSALMEKGPRRVPMMTIPKMIGNLAPGNLAIKINAQGPCYAVVTACASGTDAIGTAVKWIEDGTLDAVVTGGVEAPVTPMAVAGFCMLKALSTHHNDEPQVASRPFSKSRDGFVIGEGAGLLVLEEYEHAKKRGAKIYAEFAGYGQSCDAYHVTAPHPEGRGGAQAMNMALNRAGMKPEDIDYINAHGTSTAKNDSTETMAIKNVFGDHAYKLKVSSTKSMTGHCVGGAGGIEAIACVLAIRDQYFPATINYTDEDPECDLDYVPNKGVNGKIDATMSNSLGFGGHNGIVIFKKFVE